MSTLPYRAKTVLAAADHAEIGLLHERVLLTRHALDPAGSVYFPRRDLPERCAARAVPGRRSPTLTLTVTDVSATPGPDRIRGRVCATGTVTLLTGPLPAGLGGHLGVTRPADVVRLTPERVRLDWRVENPHAGAVAVDLDEFVAAPVDPLGGWENGWVAHLAGAHTTALRALVAAHTPLHDDDLVRPVFADTDGLVLRVNAQASTRDVRVPFRTPVRCGCEATNALDHLLSAAGHRR